MNCGARRVLQPVAVILFMLLLSGVASARRPEARGAGVPSVHGLPLGDGGGRDGHMPATPPAAEANRSALDLLDEQYVRGEISREEYLRKREDLTKLR